MEDSLAFRVGVPEGPGLVRSDVIVKVIGLETTVEGKLAAAKEGTHLGGVGVLHRG